VSCTSNIFLSAVELKHNGSSQNVANVDARVAVAGVVALRVFMVCVQVLFAVSCG
jgi:hypothetical protein